jgi:hypothetical protein
MTQMTRINADLFRFLSAMIRVIRVIRVLLIRPLLLTTVKCGATSLRALRFFEVDFYASHSPR